jgi:hypothetical protein
MEFEDNAMGNLRGLSTGTLSSLGLNGGKKGNRELLGLIFFVKT